MKLFFSEFKANYEKYHFPYQVWLLREKNDEVEKIYELGFLPIRSIKDVYYLSRNIRINLTDFELSSENRRILKKTENFDAQLVSLSEFKYSPAVQKFCKEYGEKRFAKGFLKTTEIKSIFSGLVFSHVFVFTQKNSKKPVGYAVCYISDHLLHYAHSFYDLDYFQENLGAGMMLRAVIWGKSNFKKYAYLGTCYEQNALYKTAFKGIEFFNGFRWSTNLQELKSLIEQKDQEYLLKNKEYIDLYYKRNLLDILNNFGVRVKL